MTLKTQIASDISTVFLNYDEFAESGTVLTVAGATIPILFIRAGITDQIGIEPGYADSDTFVVSQAVYAQPKQGDQITDESSVVWLVESGARLNAGMWDVPVKSDRRVRA